MSAKKTRHLKQFVIDEGGRFVYNGLTGRYHYRLSNALEDWPELVQKVKDGQGAELLTGDLEWFRSIATTTIIMG